MFELLISNEEEMRLQLFEFKTSYAHHHKSFQGHEELHRKQLVSALQCLQLTISHPTNTMDMMRVLHFPCLEKGKDQKKKKISHPTPEPDRGTVQNEHLLDHPVEDMCKRKI